MLILTRKPGELITIRHDLSLDPATPVGDLFLDGPIEIGIVRVNGCQVKIGIQADPRLHILRAELYDRESII